MNSSRALAFAALLAASSASAAGPTAARLGPGLSLGPMPTLAPALRPHVEAEIASHRLGLFAESPLLIVGGPSAAALLSLQPAQPWDKEAVSLPEGRSVIGALHAYALTPDEGLVKRRFMTPSARTLADLRAYLRADAGGTGTADSLARLFEGVVEQAVREASR